MNKAEVTLCCFCDTRLSQNHAEISVSKPAPARVEGNLLIAEDWRSEVSHRLEAHRERRRRLHGDAAQPELSFVRDSAEALVETLVEETPVPPAPPAAAVQAPRRRRSRLDRMEIDIAQPTLDFGEPGNFAAPAAPLSNFNPAFPVAPLAERRRAGVIDAALLLFAYGGFLALFAALGGRLTDSKTDFVVVAITLAIFYAQYLLLFTFFGGATPGMMLRGLSILSFDGKEPESRQLLWRVFGYLLSGGTLMLGFLWALWDDDHLALHDRISHTYLTQNEGQLAAGGASHTRHLPYTTGR